MLTVKEGRAVAAEKLKAFLSCAALYDEPIHSGEYGWVFAYQSVEYMRTNNMRDMLVGNSPILVDKHTGDALLLGSGLPAETYVENYVACGDPFKFLGKRVELSGGIEPPKKTDAIRSIRRHAMLSLIGAKLHIDECIAGNTTIVTCPSVDVARILVRDLRSLGLSAQHLRD